MGSIQPLEDESALAQRHHDMRRLPIKGKNIMHDKKPI
jgi:hypothetical protein